MKVTINPYNPRTPRDNRDFINTLINDEKAPRQRGSMENYFSQSSYHKSEAY